MLQGRADLTDLFPEFRRIVETARSEAEFKATMWGWIDGQRDGVLGPFLRDIEQFFSRLRSLTSWAEAQETVARLADTQHAERALAACARVEAISGQPLDCAVILLAGLERPEGYSRFHCGRNTVHVALDYPSNLRHPDHFEIIMAHELIHSLRDPLPEVLADRGGWPAMTHDQFVARYPFREHLVSEALATAASELAYPGRAPQRYVYIERDELAWCEAHRPEIVARVRHAIDVDESFRTFFATDVVAPGSPECCDYYLALHLGRFALRELPLGELLATPCSAFLERFWTPFVAEFLAGTPPSAAPPDAAGPQLERAVTVDLVAPQAARFYRELLLEWTSADPRQAGLEEQLIAAATKAGLTYGAEAYDVYPFPLVLTPDDLDYLRWVTERLAALIERVVELYRTNVDVRSYFALPPHLEQLALLEPGYRPYVPVGRFDSYWNGRRVQFLELNTNGTAGVVLADRLPELAEQLPLLRPLLRRHGLGRLQLRAKLAETLRDAWRQARPDQEAPGLVAILDWAGQPTASELTQLAEFLTAQGLPATVVHPEQLTYDGRRLEASGRPVDLVYRRLTTTDMVERAEQLQPLFAACRADAVVVVGSFPADVAHSKRVFAFLTDERWRSHFDMDDRALIDAHLPWTRILRPGRTIYRGRAGEVRDLALELRERMVLKPTESYEGRGVLLGIEASPELWAAEVERRMGGGHLIQEFIEPPQRVVHVAGADGAVHEQPLFLHVGEFVLSGRMAGLLVRASLERVLAAKSTERALPCFVLAPDLGDDSADAELR